MWIGLFCQFAESIFMLAEMPWHTQAGNAQLISTILSSSKGGTISSLSLRQRHTVAKLFCFAVARWDTFSYFTLRCVCFNQRQRSPLLLLLSLPLISLINILPFCCRLARANSTSQPALNLLDWMDLNPALASRSIFFYLLFLCVCSAFINEKCDNNWIFFVVACSVLCLSRGTSCSLLCRGSSKKYRCCSCIGAGGARSAYIIRALIQQHWATATAHFRRCVASRASC